MNHFDVGACLYDNTLSQEQDLTGWIKEGKPVLSFPQGCLRLENGMDSAEGQAANYVMWCPVKFPNNILVRWSFRPIQEPGLAMFWFRANGRNDKDLFDPTLQKRSGQYRQYFDGDINALHASYFRRKQPDERRFHTCNLRKSKGFHLVAQGADPIPSVDAADGWYNIEVAVVGPYVRFSIDGLVSYSWCDDGTQFGPVLDQQGYVGFRQMAPLIAEYKNLTVHEAHIVEHKDQEII